MNRMTLLLAAGLALVAGQAAGQNIQTEALRVWMDNITISADGTTSTRLMVYENDGERDYTAFNMSLIVPDGITVAQVKKGREWVNSIELTERAAESHSISCNMPDATTIKIICSSNQNDDFYPDDEDGNPMDALFTIDLIANPQMMNGTYAITTEGVVFGHNQGNTVTGYVPQSQPSFQLTITGGQDGLSIPYTVTSSGVETLVLPFDAEVPDGLTTYTATGVVNNHILLAQQPSIKAGTPLIVVGEPGNYVFKGVAATNETEFSEWVLTGTTEQKVIDEGYVLQRQNTVTGFYRVDAERPVTVPAYRCWLNYDGADVERLMLDVPTNILKVNSGVAQDDEWYSLDGRRTANPSKGIYVKQGDKKAFKR